MQMCQVHFQVKEQLDGGRPEAEAMDTGAAATPQQVRQLAEKLQVACAKFAGIK